MDLTALREAIAADEPPGFRPFLIVGTAGTVDVGAFDELKALADIAAAQKCWFHVDGAFGALAALSPTRNAAHQGHRPGRIRSPSISINGRR